MHTIGIDFGTSKTLVSRIDADTGKPVTIRLGQGTDYLPTSVYISDSGKMYFGDEADDRLADNTGVYLRGFKMSLGSSIPVYVHYTDEGESTAISAREMVYHYLRFIREKTQELAFMGEKVSTATITRPVNFSAAQCEELRLAAIDAGFTEVTFTTEPEAAGLAFCRLNAANAFRNRALIVDWGGGTLDFALVTRDEDSISTHSELTDGDTTMGGERFDDYLWSYAEDFLKRKNIIGIKHTTALSQIRKCKEKLSTAEETQLYLSSSNGTCPPIPLTRALFNKLIEADIEKAIVKVQQLLERIPEDKKPEMLLLVGGSSRIPLIRERLEATCKLPAIAWEHSRTAVSLGASLWSGNAAGSICATAEIKDIASMSEDEAKAKLKELYIEYQDYKETFFSAVRKNDIGMLVLLLQAKVNYILGRADLLLAAAEYGSTDCVKELLKRGFRSKKDWRPLTQAIISGNTEIVKRLLKAGHNPNKIDHGYTPIIWALIHRQYAIYTILKEAGANINKGKKNKTAIQVAKKRKDAYMLRTLKEDGAKAYVFTIKSLLKAASGLAALFFLTGILACALVVPAIEYGSTMLLRSCLAHPLTRCIPNTLEGPLRKAAGNGNEEHVRILLDAGADAHYSEMMYRAIENGHANIAEMLLDAGADANYKPYVTEESALCLAIEQKNASLTKKLIQNGANTNVTDDNGWTPLAYAVKRGNIHLVKLLLEHGADTNMIIPDASCPTPLFIATSHDNLFIMQSLINAGADVNLRNDSQGNTPLHIAAMRNNEQCIKCLIDANANQYVTNKNGMRAKYLSQMEHLFN